jgi:hypothetical protein
VAIRQPESPSFFRQPETMFVRMWAQTIFANQQSRLSVEGRYPQELVVPPVPSQLKGSKTAPPGDSPELVATSKLKTTRLAMPPRYRPEAILKRDIYRFACGVFDRGYQGLLERLVRDKSYKLNLAVRERQWTVIDWAVRYVRIADGEGGASSPQAMYPHATLSEGGASLLFNDTKLARYSTELNFAFAHNIKPELCTTFIDECGGHEIIGVMISSGAYRDYDAPWVRALKGELRVRVLDQTGQLGRRTLSIVPFDEDDPLEQGARHATKPKRFKVVVKNAAGEVRVVRSGKKRKRG